MPVRVEICGITPEDDPALARIDVITAGEDDNNRKVRAFIQAARNSA